MDTVLTLVQLLAILLVSVVLHENAHGWTALALGDPTAKAAGRLTLNPIPHLDPVGSVILPAFIAVASGGATTFGYAKPVPVSPMKLRGADRWGFALVAIAGPVSNIVIAFVAITALRWVGDPFNPGLLEDVLVATFAVNVFLAAFNLVPIPPLDGSRLLRPFLSQGGRYLLDRFEPYGFLVILLLVTLLQEPFFNVVVAIRDAIVRLLPL